MKSFFSAQWLQLAASNCGDCGFGRMFAAIYRLAIFALVGVMVSGCSVGKIGSMFGGSSDEVTGSVITSPTTGEQSLAVAANAMMPIGPMAGSVGDCPRISVWQNDKQLTIYEIGRIGDNLAIRHRGEITKTERECEMRTGQVTVKYGVAGRVLLGPTGRPGTVRLPLLVYVTDRSRKKIKTVKLSINVNLAKGKPYGNFSSVQRISFPIPDGTPAGEYSVFVAFDNSAPGAG